MYFIQEYIIWDLLYYSVTQHMLRAQLASPLMVCDGCSSRHQLCLNAVFGGKTLNYQLSTQTPFIQIAHLGGNPRQIRFLPGVRAAFRRFRRLERNSQTSIL